MIEVERYLDFNEKPLKLLRYVFCELQVNDSYVKKARTLIAKTGTKSIIGSGYQHCDINWCLEVS